MSEKKVALVTGASRGIGRATAVELARAGYFIVINYNANEDAAKETLKQVREAGAEGEIAQFDVMDTQQTTEKLKEVVERHKKIQVLVSNAGITADGLFMMMGEDEWDSVINTTLKGFFNVTRMVLREMVKSRCGSIVAVSSLAAIAPNRGQANYAAAKAGLIGACRSLSKEVARFGIRVNVVAPGLIKTEMIEGAPVAEMKKMIPMERMGRPEEVARVIRFLCSGDASYMTGQVVGVNGGVY
ncbi:MAG TPA: 3-oxoacyl-ACP reductase FabG [Deltaproteobacteria bacterium]|nr:3-oxoacyl-ACP reductase FabG [Deltaproteobacteria bacterium]